MDYYNFHQFADASAQPKITQKPLEKQEYIIPPISLQNEFAEFVKLIDKSKFIVQQQIKDLEELLDSKMDEYFR
jgi:type I restriction enzyme S subunit